MNVAADAAPGGAPWLVIVLAVLTFPGIWVTARAPVWLEKAKNKFGKPTKEIAATPAEKIASGEAVLREWLEATLKENERLERKVAKLTADLNRLNWTGGRDDR